MTAPRTPSGCTGACEQGQRDCTCGRMLCMWDDELDNPPHAALRYLAAVVISIALSVVWPLGCAA